RRVTPGNAVPARAALEGSDRGGAGAFPRRRARPSRRPSHRRVPDPPGLRPPARLFQHRGADQRVHVAAAPGRGALDSARGRVSAGRGRRRERARQLPPGLGPGACARRADAAARPGVHDPALPRPGGHERADHRRDRPQVGDGGVQGQRDPDRQDPRASAGLVDIRTTGGPATAEEVAAVDGLLGPPEAVHHHLAYGGRMLRTRRHLLLPVLHAIQDRAGWVSRGALEYACRRLSIPPAEAYGVVSFYARFALEPRGDVALHVCDDIVCSLAGVEKPEGARLAPCLGLCDRAPATLTERFGAVYEAVQTPSSEPSGYPGASLLRRIGVVDPDSIDSYLQHGGFSALKRERGYLDFEIEVRRGAGAYICGEETALFNSIEGKRGEPRNKPPFPVEVGLFGKPTLPNNVETLVNVLEIVGGEFADTRLFCVSGHVLRPGVYEVPMGTPLRALIEMAGGLAPGRTMQAVLLGGAAGSF